MIGVFFFLFFFKFLKRKTEKSKQTTIHMFLMNGKKDHRSVNQAVWKTSLICCVKEEIECDENSLNKHYNMPP